MYNINGLPCWSEAEIDFREYLTKYLSSSVRDILLSTNPAWQMIRIEAPQLTPCAHINSTYSEKDYFSVGDGLALRPETTGGSYVFIKEILKSHPPKFMRPPVCIWQMGKSFRKEQDQPSKYCRYKEFYQLEFQCIYTTSSKCDYYGKVVSALSGVFEQVRTTFSDRTPEYSEITTDLEMEYMGRWMEVASISKRTDFDADHEVLEIAFGLDRLIKVLGEAKCR